jgi:predicted nucleotidyltransferase
MDSEAVSLLIDRLKGQKSLFTRYSELAVVYLFGSMGRGDPRDDSDVDIGLVFQRRGDTAIDHHRSIGDLASRLEQVVFPHRVDLVVLEEQGLVFCLNALSEGIALYVADRTRQVDFESDVYVRALDFLPTYRLATGERLSGLRRWLRSRAVS